MNSKKLYIQCQIHKDGYYQFLALMKDIPTKRFICCECLYYDQTLSNQEKNIIPLTIAIRSPEEMILKLKLDSGTKLLYTIFQICDMNLDTSDNLQNIQQQFKSWKTQILEKIQYTSFMQLMKEFQNLEFEDSDQNSQIIERLSKIIDDMIKDDCALITNTIKEVLTQKQSIHGMCELFSAQNTQSILLEEFQSTLFQKIEGLSNKKINNKNLIYQGKEDLNITSFWDNVNGKNNILMVFKSRSSFVFGGYSPCQWDQSTNNYIADETQSSFLFSQTLNEIFPIKKEKQQFAILRYTGYSSGPVFGAGHDMYIDSDFKRGNSNLGHTYKWDKYQGQSSNHLFGESKPYIQECEVYQIIFI